MCVVSFKLGETMALSQAWMAQKITLSSMLLYFEWCQRSGFHGGTKHISHNSSMQMPGAELSILFWEQSIWITWAVSVIGEKKAFQPTYPPTTLSLKSGMLAELWCNNILCKRLCAASCSFRNKHIGMSIAFHQHSFLLWITECILYLSFQSNRS